MAVVAAMTAIASAAQSAGAFKAAFSGGGENLKPAAQEVKAKARAINQQFAVLKETNRALNLELVKQQEISRQSGLRIAGVVVGGLMLGALGVYLVY